MNEAILKSVGAKIVTAHGNPWLFFNNGIKFPLSSRFTEDGASSVIAFDADGNQHVFVLDGLEIAP